MKNYNNPDRSNWKSIGTRPVYEADGLQDVIQKIYQEVIKDGDQGVDKLSQHFDGASFNNSSVIIPSKIDLAGLVDHNLEKSIKQAYQNIYGFHKAQVKKDVIVETMPGIKCIQRSVPIQKVGIYIPGGTAPLFSSILMLAIPAKIAGCKEIVMCTPPDKDGQIHPAMLFAAALCGVDKIFPIGGAQAIAAMAVGTETVPKVDKICGPGNQYVTAAKEYAARYGVAMDMPAGPSELLVYADNTCFPAYVAADLLSQAEHGSDSQVVLVSTHSEIIKQVNEEIEIQLEQLPRKNIATQSLASSFSVCFDDKDVAMDFINEYAPEHLILASDYGDDLAEKVVQAGSVFIGNYTPESAGDYASGTNHTLPTNGWARSMSGVNLSTFQKEITFQKMSREGLLSLSDSIVRMAEAEQLDAHARAVKIRNNGWSK